MTLMRHKKIWLGRSSPVASSVRLIKDGVITESVVFATIPTEESGCTLHANCGLIARDLII